MFFANTHRAGAAALVLALCLAFLPGATGAEAASRTPAVTGEITGPTTISPGGTTVVHSRYTKSGTNVAAATVMLQKYSGGKWVDAAPIIIKDGWGKRTIYPKGTTRYRIRNYDGSAISSSFNVTVRSAAVTGKITGPTTISPGGTTVVHSRYTKSGTNVAAATVMLQKYSGGKWVDAAPITIKDGWGKRTIYPKGTTKYRIRNYNGSAISSTFNVKVTGVPSSFTIRGSGFGHGVGMSQYGAYAQALAGRQATTILEHYYSGSDASWRSTERNVAVQVFGPEPYGYSKGQYSDEKSTTTTTVSGGTWRLRSSSGTTLTSGSGRTTIAWRAMSDGRTKAWVNGKAYYDRSGVALQWSGTRYLSSSGTKATISIPGTHGIYRHGQLTVSEINGRINVVNNLLLNTEYLYGIAEMPSSWGTSDRSALAAQAIAARSYAMAQTMKTACACQVVDDVRDQQFSGWVKENEGTNAYYGKIWKAAVNDTVKSSTNALLLTYGGKPVVTHYFSSSGGRTVNSEDVWSSVVPYERSVADPWSLSAPGNSMASWTRTITQSSARSLFGLSDVASISVSKKSSGGTMMALTARSSTGATSTISGKSDSLRVRLGRATTHGSLPAAWVSSIG